MLSFPAWIIGNPVDLRCHLVYVRSEVDVLLGSKNCSNYRELWLWPLHCCKSNLDLPFSEPNHKQQGNLLLLDSLYFSTQLYSVSYVCWFITLLFWTCVLRISTLVISIVQCSVTKDFSFMPLLCWVVSLVFMQQIYITDITK